MPEGILVVDGYRRVLSVAGLSTESHSRQDALTHVFQTALTLDMLEFCTVSEGASKVQSALAAAGMVRVNDTNTVRRLFSQYSAGGPNYTSDRDGNLLTVNTPNTQRVGYRQQVWSVPDHHRDS